MMVVYEEKCFQGHSGIICCNTTSGHWVKLSSDPSMQFQFSVFLCFLLVLRNNLSLAKPPVLMGLATVAADTSKMLFFPKAEIKKERCKIWIKQGASRNINCKLPTFRL